MFAMIYVVIITTRRADKGSTTHIGSDKGKFRLLCRFKQNKFCRPDKSSVNDSFFGLWWPWKPPETKFGVMKAHFRSFPTNLRDIFPGHTTSFRFQRILYIPTYQSTWGCGIVYNVFKAKDVRSCLSILNTQNIVYTVHSILFQYILARKRLKSLIFA